MTVKIADLLSVITSQGGMAFSNTYKVTFEDFGSKLESNLSTLGFNTADFYGDRTTAGKAVVVSLMCDEANLPGAQAASGQVNGIYTGSGVYNYAHTKIFNDLTLSWVCDAQMIPLKFLQAWMDTIFVDEDSKKYETAFQPAAFTNSEERREYNRSTRLNYPVEYQARLSIVKAERGSASGPGGGGELARPSIRYRFDNIWPYSIDTIPLSFGASQLVKVSANFYYERWYTYHVKPAR